MAGKEGSFTNSMAVEPAASCWTGKKVGEAEPAAVETREAEKPYDYVAALSDEKLFVMMSKERVDYILSRDVVEITEAAEDKEDKKIHIHRQEAVHAWSKAYRLERAEYQARVRKEYEAHGYVKVEAVDDYDFQNRMSDTLKAAFCKAFATDIRLEVIPEDA